MTTYRAIASTETDPEAPITSTLMKAFQQNVLAIAEGDSTVPDALRVTQFLGTLTTTSGNSQTLSGLVLTSFRFIFASFNGVSVNSATPTNITIGTAQVASLASSASLVTGWVLIDLTGSGFALANGNTNVLNGPQNHTLTTAATSISAVSSASPTFDAGSVKIYGIK